MRIRAALFALLRVAVSDAIQAYSASHGCYLGEQCDPPAYATLTSQSWGQKLVYALRLEVGHWTEGAIFTLLVAGRPALITVGHATGCRILKSGESALSVALTTDDGSDVCSMVVQASREMVEEELRILCSGSKYWVICPPPFMPPPPPSPAPAAPPPSPLPPRAPPSPYPPPSPLAPDLTLVRDDCSLGVRARFTLPPTGIAGVLWKLQLEFDRWTVGMHVIIVFSKWDDREHIEMSRFPVRLVEVAPIEAATSPTVGRGEGLFKRPPGKIELVLRETPVKLFTLSMYGGARDVAALYCARPEDPPPPPPLPAPKLPPPLLPPAAPETVQHIDDLHAVIAGASNFDSSHKGKTSLVSVTSLIVFLSVAVLGLIAGGAIITVRSWRKLRYRQLHRSVRRRARAQNESGAMVVPRARDNEHRVKLIFEDEHGADVAVDLDLTGMSSALELHDEVVLMYESTGQRTDDNDVLELHYKDAAGRMLAVTADTPLSDVIAAGLLRLTRDGKAPRFLRAPKRVAAAPAPVEQKKRLMYGDDEDLEADALSMIMQRRLDEVGSAPAAEQSAPSGVLAVHNSLADQVTSSRPLLPVPRGGSRASEARNGARSSRDRRRAAPADDDDDDESDDDADLIYRQHQRREAGRAGARSMAM